MTKARDLSKLLGTNTNGVIPNANLDVSFENIVDTGTEGTKVATGTSAQRGSTTGQLRFNTTIGLAEYFDGTNFKSIDAPPTIGGISPSTATTANQNITITGAGFSSGATVYFIGADGTEYASPSVTVNSSQQIIAQTPSSALTVANEPYDIKVINPSNLFATLSDALDAGGTPTWNTASGSLGNVFEGDSVSLSISATDPDGQTISYSETGGTNLSSNGYTLNSSTGAITGTAGTVSADTTISFTGRASDGVNTSDRAFSFVVKDTLETNANTLAYFDFASGKSYDTSSTLQDLTSRNKDLPMGNASYNSANGGVVIGSSTQNFRSSGLIGSISEISMGCWVKLQGSTNKGVIYYGDTATNNHFFVRDGINGQAYNFDVGKDVNGADSWARSKYNGSDMANYITGVSGYASKFWYYVVRINSSGVVTCSLNKSTFETVNNTGVNMSGHSGGQFGIFGDPYDDNASSHTIGVAWWYNGVISQALSDSIYDRYASRFGY